MCGSKTGGAVYDRARFLNLHTVRGHRPRLQRQQIALGGYRAEQLLFPFLRKVSVNRLSLRRRPDRFWKVSVVLEAWNHMPVQVRHGVPEARKVHFERAKRFPYRLLHCNNHSHELFAFGIREVAHLADVTRADYTAEPGVIIVFDADHTAQLVLPEQ